MTIRDMEAKTGVSRANIRYYEAQGLLHPKREANGYRNYTEDDLLALERIRLLRGLDMSLEEILAVQTGRTTLTAALERQSDALSGQQDRLRRCAAVVKLLIEEGAEYARLDPAPYMELLDAPASDAPPKQGRPLQRYLARELDRFLCLFLAALIPHVGAALIWLLGTVLLLLLEPACITLFGTTPGKAVFGLRVTDLEDRKLSYVDALLRTWTVLWEGMGLGVPILSLYFLGKSWLRQEEGEPLSWEDRSEVTSVRRSREAVAPGARTEYQEMARKNTRLGLGCLAAVVIVILAVNLLLRQVVYYGRGSAYAYEGPVLPMTALSGGDALTVSRQVDFDFAAFDGAGDFLEPNEAIITDSYILTNRTEEAVTAELLYPYLGSLSGEERFRPAITVDGAQQSVTTLSALGAPDADDWKTFREAFGKADHLSEALTPARLPEETVTVYHFTGLSGTNTGEEYLAARYTMDPEKTTVWVFGAVGMVDDDETGLHARILHIPSAEDPWVADEAYLIVRGEDIADLTLQGYDSYDLTEDHRIEGVTGQAERWEATLTGVISHLAERWRTWPQYEDHGAERISAETLAQGAMKRLADPDYHSAAVAYKSFSALFESVLTERTLQYAAFALTIAPGESVTVSAGYHQQASRGSMGLGEAAETFDLATKLGSSLRLEDQSASLSNWEGIEITGQNFGFDPDRGVTAVTLDPETERYYMTVKPK